jgi:hypothetical protein
METCPAFRKRRRLEAVQSKVALGSYQGTRK